MDNPKTEILKKMEAKGLNVSQLAKSIEFSPMLLDLYLAGDSFPIPTRIMKKLDEALAN